MDTVIGFFICKEIIEDIIENICFFLSSDFVHNFGRGRRGLGNWLPDSPSTADKSWGRVGLPTACFQKGEISSTARKLVWNSVFVYK